MEKFKYFDFEVDLGLEFGVGVLGYFFVLRAFACLFFAAFALNLFAMFINYMSMYYVLYYEVEFEIVIVLMVDVFSGCLMMLFYLWFVDWYWANSMSASLGIVAFDDVS